MKELDEEARRVEWDIIRRTDPERWRYIRQQVERHDRWYDALGPAIVAFIVIIVICFLYMSAMAL